jgi:hypothetical protein
MFPIRSRQENSSKSPLRRGSLRDRGMSPVETEEFIRWLEQDSRHAPLRPSVTIRNSNSSAKAYLFSTARNAAFDYFRRRKIDAGPIFKDGQQFNFGRVFDRYEPTDACSRA